MYVGIYVDDLLILGKLQSEIDKLKLQFNKRFKMTDLGLAKYIIGIASKRDMEHGTLFLSQEAYARKVLRQYNMEECNPSSTPIEPTAEKQINAKTAGEPKREDPKYPFRSAIGSTMYLQVATRPDLACFVRTMSQYLTNFGPLHWSYAKRCLRYIQKTKNHGLLYTKSDRPNVLPVYCDADHATCAVDRRSVAGYVTFLGNNLISWSSKRMKTVALCSTESEYMTLSFAVQEAIFMRRLLSELQVQ